MDRERWQSYPIENPEDRLFLALLAVAGREDQFNVTAESESGATRPLRVRRSIHVEEPLPGAESTGQVVCRIEFDPERPRPDETVRENLWRLASDYLDRTEVEAKALLSTAVGIPATEKSHAFEYVIDVTHDGTVHRYGIPRLSTRAATLPMTEAPKAPDAKTRRIEPERKPAPKTHAAKRKASAKTGPKKH